jgi:16S rRNA G1207 methylase RsmC
MQKKDKVLNHYFAAHPKSKLRLGMFHTYLRGMPFQFLTASGVFSSKRVDLGTRLLVECMLLPREGCVLDVGCGYGVVGIAAAVFKSALDVVMVDVNERAVRLAKENIEINKVTNAEVKRGHLYEPVKEMTFNCVLSNPPVSAGMEIVKTLIAEAPEHMVKRATFQMVLRSKIAGKRMPSFLEEAFGNCGVLARKSGYRVLIAEKR